MSETIYFLSDGAGAIKVGFSRQPERRVAALKGGDRASLSLIGMIAGTRAAERLIHSRLEQHRLRAEWFEDCDSVRSLIEGLLVEGAAHLCAEIENPTPLDHLVAEARDVARIIIRQSRLLSGSSVNERICQIEEQYDIPSGTLWKLHYRPRKDLSAGTYFALLSAAERILADVNKAVERDLCAVRGIVTFHARADESARRAGAELERLKREIAGPADPLVVAAQALVEEKE